VQHVRRPEEQSRENRDSGPEEMFSDLMLERNCGSCTMRDPGRTGSLLLQHEIHRHISFGKWLGELTRTANKSVASVP
jgi:hypothetical protein